MNEITSLFHLSLVTNCDSLYLFYVLLWNEFGDTPLISACRTGDVGIVKSLLEYRPDIDVQNKEVI